MLARIERTIRAWLEPKPEVPIEDSAAVIAFLERHPQVVEIVNLKDDRDGYLNTAIALENALEINSVASRFLFDSEGNYLIELLDLINGKQTPECIVTVSQRFLELFVSFCGVFYNAIKYDEGITRTEEEIYGLMQRHFDMSQAAKNFYAIALLDSQYHLLPQSPEVVVLDIFRPRDEDDVDVLIEQMANNYEEVVFDYEKDVLEQAQGVFTIDALSMVSQSDCFISDALVGALRQKAHDPSSFGNSLRSIALYAHRSNLCVIERSKFLDQLKMIFVERLDRSRRAEFELMPSHEQVHLLRKYLVRYPRIAVALLANSGTSRELFSDIEICETRLFEDPYHPFRRIGVTIGYEIEFETPPIKINGLCVNEYLEILNTLGIKRGAINQHGCSEISPGPFNTPKAGVLVLEILQRLGLIDLDSKTGQALHLNIGINHENNFSAELVRRLSYISHLTGLSYSPKFTELIDNKSPKGIRVFAKEASGQKYYEVKDFSVLGVEAFNQAWLQFGWLAWAANAYNKVQTHSGLPIPTSSDIKNSPFCTSIKDLARIWRDLICDLQHGLRQIYVQSGNLGMSIGDPDYFSAQKVREEVLLVYPKTTYAGIADISAINGSHVHLEGAEYPNLVYFAQCLVNKAVTRVETIANRANQDTKRILKRINEAGIDNSQELISKFLRRYGYSEANAPFVVQKMVVEHLIRLYQEVSLL